MAQHHWVCVLGLFCTSSGMGLQDEPALFGRHSFAYQYIWVVLS